MDKILEVIKNLGAISLSNGYYSTLLIVATTLRKSLLVNTYDEDSRDKILQYISKLVHNSYTPNDLSTYLVNRIDSLKILTSIIDIKFIIEEIIKKLEIESNRFISELISTPYPKVSSEEGTLPYSGITLPEIKDYSNFKSAIDKYKTVTDARRMNMVKAMPESTVNQMQVLNEISRRNDELVYNLFTSINILSLHLKVIDSILVLDGVNYNVLDSIRVGFNVNKEVLNKGINTLNESLITFFNNEAYIPLYNIDLEQFRDDGMFPTLDNIIHNVNRLSEGKSMYLNSKEDINNRLDLGDFDFISMLNNIKSKMEECKSISDENGYNALQKEFTYVVTAMEVIQKLLILQEIYRCITILESNKFYDKIETMFNHPLFQMD